MKWYEYDIKERYDKVYSKHTLDDFWSWWSDDRQAVMEVRVKNWQLVKEYSDKFHAPHASCGIFVDEAWKLKKVVDYFTNQKDDMWFAINPKRQLTNKFGKPAYSSKDVNISEIKFLFIDIDRVVKDGPANKEDLMKADFLAEKIISVFGEAGFDKNYCKICSGNGIQLIFKLDVPFELPTPRLDEQTGTYIEEALFVDIKNVIKNGIGKMLPTISDKFKDEYNVEVDRVCFNAGRIGALPYTFNQKFDTPIPRGIITIVEEGKNEGFSDWLKGLQQSKQQRVNVKQSYKNIKPLQLSEEYKVLHNELHKNVIVDLMLKYKFPEGGINNTLWYAVKILFHNSGICTNDNDFTQVHEMLKQFHGRSFSTNGLEPQFKGNYNGAIKDNAMQFVAPMVNKYLRQHKIVDASTGKSGYKKPIFPVSPRGKRMLDIKIVVSPKVFSSITDTKYTISKEKEDPLVDLQELQNKLYAIRRGDDIDEDHMKSEFEFTAIGVLLVRQQLNDLFVAFMHEFRKKWGDEITVYMMRYYMDQYVNYKRW